MALVFCQHLLSEIYTIHKVANFAFKCTTFLIPKMAPACWGNSSSTCWQGKAIGVEWCILSPWVPNVDGRWLDLKPQMEPALQELRSCCKALLQSPILKDC